MKASFLLAGLLLTASAAHAQLGVRAGVNSARFFTTTTPGQSVYSLSHLGYQVGLFYDLPLDHHFSFVPELAFSHEYMHYGVNQFSRGYYAFNGDVRLSYLSLPVLTRASLGPAYLEAGPQFNWLIGGRDFGREYTDNANGPLNYYDVDRAVTDHYQRLDAGLVCGAGVQLRSGLGMGVRAYWGLRSLAREDYAPEQGFQGELRNATLQLNLSYRLKRAGS